MTTELESFGLLNNTGTMNPGQYVQVSTVLPCYVRNTTGFSDGSVGAEDFTTSGLITLDFRMRLFALTPAKGFKRELRYEAYYTAYSYVGQT